MITEVRRPHTQWLDMYTGKPLQDSVNTIDTGYLGQERHISLATIKRNGASVRALTACGTLFEDDDDWMAGHTAREYVTCPECKERYSDVFDESEQC